MTAVKRIGMLGNHEYKHDRSVAAAALAANL